MSLVPNTCVYVYIISKYIVSILQVMNVHFSQEYRNNLISTKCLNTAVMLVVILLGKDKIKQIQQCDVTNTIKRHVSFEENNMNIATRLTKSLCTPSKHAYLYYIMLTDAELANSVFDNEKKYFPGHVFIVEKRNDNRYIIYQSFIAKYTLNDFIVKNKCKLYTKKKVLKMCKFFKQFLDSNFVWNKESVKMWKALTGVDTTDFISYKTKKIYLCFKKFKITKLKETIQEFVNRSLDDIEYNIYNNNMNHYHSDNYVKNNLSAVPYDIMSLKKHFVEMKEALNNK